MEFAKLQELDGGAKGDRTPDLGIANAALSQLSYRPFRPWAGQSAQPFEGGRNLISPAGKVNLNPPALVTLRHSG